MIPGIVFLGIFSGESYEIDSTTATSRFFACDKADNFTVEFGLNPIAIKKNLFKDCSLLTGTIDFSNTSIVIIHMEAFQNTKISKVIFNNNIFEIHRHAFRGCTKLTHVENFNSTTITTIPAQLFKGSGIESIHVPSSVTEIFEEAFEECTNLETISGLESTNIYELVDIGNGGSVHNIDFPRKLRLLKGNFPAFSGAINLQHTELTMISRKVFENIQVDTFLFPTSLEVIDDKALFNTKINAPVDLSDTNVKVIGDNAFQSSDMQQIKFSSGLRRIGIGAFQQTKFGAGHIDLSETSIREIGQKAFKSSNITSILFPATLEVLGSSVFSSCTHLSGKILLGDTKLKHIPTKAFYNTGIEHLELPQSTTSILANAFESTGQLRSILFSGQDYIASNAFEGSNCSSTVTYGTSFCNCNNNNVSCFPPSPLRQAPTPPSPGSSSMTLRSSLLCFLGFVFAI